MKNVGMVAPACHPPSRARGNGWGSLAGTLLLLFAAGAWWSAAEGGFPGKDDPRSVLRNLPPPIVIYPGTASFGEDLWSKEPVPLPRPKAPPPPASATKRVPATHPAEKPRGGASGTPSVPPPLTGSATAAVLRPASSSRPILPTPASGTAIPVTPPASASVAAVRPVAQTASASAATVRPAAQAASASMVSATPPVTPAADSPTAKPASPPAQGTPPRGGPPKAGPASGSSPIGAVTASGPAGTPATETLAATEPLATEPETAAEAESAPSAASTAEAIPASATDEDASATAVAGEAPADGSGEPPVEEGVLSDGAQGVLVEARKLRQDGKWVPLLKLLQDNSEAAGTPEGMGMLVECQLNATKVNYTGVMKSAKALLEKAPNDPYGNWGMAEALANGKKPDLAKALEHLAKARTAKNGPSGLAMRYYLLWLKKNWLFALIGLGVLIAGGDSARKKLRKRATAPDATGGEGPPGEPATAPIVTSGAEPSSGGDTVKLSVAQKVKAFFTVLVARLRRKPAAGRAGGTAEATGTTASADATEPPEESSVEAGSEAGGEPEAGANDEETGEANGEATGEPAEASGEATGEAAEDGGDAVPVEPGEDEPAEGSEGEVANAFADENEAEPPPTKGGDRA